MLSSSSSSLASGMVKSVPWMEKQKALALESAKKCSARDLPLLDMPD